MSVFNFAALVLLITTQNGIFCLTKHNNLNNNNNNNLNNNLPILTQLSSHTQRRPYETISAINELDRQLLEPDIDPYATQPIKNDRILEEPAVVNPDIEDNYLSSNEANENEFIKNLVDEIKTEEDIAIKSANLMRLLQELPEGPLPVVYIEEERDDSTYGVDKRSGRYYRRYPWKRQNARFRTGSSQTTYEADSKYQCIPSREDVFKLLVGLHENRNGNEHKTVHFCNRKRPAKAIFTNIRFLG